MSLPPEGAGRPLADDEDDRHGCGGDGDRGGRHYGEPGHGRLERNGGTVHSCGQAVEVKTGEAIPGAGVAVARAGEVASTDTGGGFVVTVRVEEDFTIRLVPPAVPRDRR